MPNQARLLNKAAESPLKSLRRKIRRRSRHSDANLFEQAWQSGATDVTLDRVAVETVHSDLERQTAEWAAAEEGLQLLRQELLDSVDRELVHHALLSLKADSRALVRRRVGGLPGTEAEIRRHREANALRRSVLRRWAVLFYDDGRTGDWFDTYERAAAMRRASVARDLQRLAGERFDQAQNHRDAAVHALNTSLRLRLLKVPPNSVVGRNDSPRRLRRLLRRPYHKKSNSQRPSLS